MSVCVRLGSYFQKWWQILRNDLQLRKWLFGIFDIQMIVFFLGGQAPHRPLCGHYSSRVRRVLVLSLVERQMGRPCLWFWSGTVCFHVCDFSQHARGLTLFSLSSSTCPAHNHYILTKGKTTSNPLGRRSDLSPWPWPSKLNVSYSGDSFACVFWFRKPSLGAKSFKTHYLNSSNC